MVFQNRPHLAEVRVCNLSVQRHETSIIAFRQQQKQLLGRRHKTRINFNLRGNGLANRMQSQQQEQQQQQQQQQQPLPLVELSPFRKSVWRREKSLPDFYERRQGLNSQQHKQQQQKDGDGNNQTISNPLSRALSNGKDKQNQQQVELTPSEMVARLSAAVQAADGELTFHGDDQIAHNQHQNSGKSRCCTHPRAEFHHESTRLWRTQDLIPGFITRLERTKTSMLSFYRDNSSCADDVGFYLGEENGGGFVNYNSSSGGSSEFSSNGAGMKVKGGRMKQQVHRRPLLYLNPLDSYRPAHDGIRDTVHPWADYSHLQSQSKLATRNNFPLASSRAREFMLNGARHATYPLRPVRHHGVRGQEPLSTDYCNSPHKFNKQLGAAKNSLEVLSSLGPPTKLEKSLVAEYQMNLERFRRERLMVPSLDLRSVPSQYVSATVNLTRGELSLQEAREANRARRRKNLLTPLGGTSSSTSSQLLNTERGSLISEGGDGNSVAALPLKKQQFSFVDPAMHPLDSVLAEESESHVLTDDDLGSASAVNALVVKATTKSAPSKMVKINDGELRRGEEDILFASTSSCVGKIQHMDSRDEFSKDSVVSAESSKKLPAQKDNEHNVTLEDDVDVHSKQDATTPVSVGGSSTSRAKTNLEYLNKLRTKGAPRPLQPLPNTPLEKDTNSSLSLQEKSGIIKDTGIVDEKNNSTDFEEKKNVNLEQVNDTDTSVGKDTTKEQVDNMAAEKLDRYENQNHISPNPVVSGISPDLQITESSTNVPITKETASKNVRVNADIQSMTDENQIKQNDLVVDASRTEEGSSTRENGAASEDEGFASPKETESPSLGTENVQVTTGNDISDDDHQKGLAQATTRSVPLSLSGGDGEPSGTVQPFLSARGDTREEITSTTPFGTPFTRVDSATLAGTPLTNLDTSLEPFSENEGGHSTSADNGDSGVSTTFLTTEDSRAEILEGVVFS